MPPAIHSYNDLLGNFKQPPEAALKYFRNKKPSTDWKKVQNEAHAHAFTVANLTKIDVLEGIQQMVDKALAEGVTMEQFQKSLEPFLKLAGWWGDKTDEVVNKDTGEISTTTTPQGSPYRLRLIFRQNVQTALMAGRYDGMMESAKNGEREFWQYIAVMDKRTRPRHAEMNELTFRFDDPFWSYFYPPNDYLCRCRVRSLGKRQIERLKIEPSKTSADDYSVLQEKNTLGKSNKQATVRIGNKELATGKGFAFNPGAARKELAAETYRRGRALGITMEKP